MPFSAMDQHQYFFDFVSENFELTYWIPGNHEYYHSNLANRFDQLHEKIRNNVFLVNNHTIVHDNVRLIFSTLWSSISDENGRDIASRMNDFWLIKYNSRLLTPNDVNELHETCLAFIKHSLRASTSERTIVMTHHVPTLINYPERYQGDVLNEAFAVELSDFIEGSGIDYWIYGHTHCNNKEFSIGRTKLVTNQLGYVHRKEHVNYKDDRVIEIN